MVDLISHALWAFAFFHDLSNAWLYVGFTLLPDLLWGAPLFIFLILTRRLGKIKGIKWHSNQKQGEVEGVPINFIHKAYHLSHSWLVMSLTSVLVFIFIPSITLPFIGGVFLHLAFDLFLHKDSVSGQMPLYPLSFYRVKGFIHWSNRKFMILNYLMLTIAYVLILIYHI